VESLKTQYIQYADLEEIKEMQNALKLQLAEVTSLKNNLKKSSI